MTWPAITGWMQYMTTQTEPRTTVDAIGQLQRIAAAVDGRPEGRDAAVLMRAVSVAADADPMLIAVEPDLSLMLPYADWSHGHRQTKAMLARVRDELVPRHGSRPTAMSRSLAGSSGWSRAIIVNWWSLAPAGGARMGRCQSRTPPDS
jgi:hypothetical protein